MCRSSTKSIGFLLLLWIGIFVPVAEYQVSHLADPASLSGLFEDTVGDDGEQGVAQTDDDGSRAYASAGADLSDFVLATCLPHVASLRNPQRARRVAEGFTSRDPPPEERPPISRAA